MGGILTPIVDLHTTSVEATSKETLVETQLCRNKPQLTRQRDVRVIRIINYVKLCYISK